MTTLRCACLIALATVGACADMEEAPVTEPVVGKTPTGGNGKLQIVSDLPHVPMYVRVDGELLVRDTGGGGTERAEIDELNTGFEISTSAGPHVVELIDETGNLWLRGDADVTAGRTSWMVAWGDLGATDFLAVDPGASDGDPDTVEFVAANRTDRTVLFERCYGTGNGPTSPIVWDCTSVHTVPPGERIAFVEPTEYRHYPDRVENLYSRFADQPEHARMIAAYLAADIYALQYQSVGILARGAMRVPQDGGWDAVAIDPNWPAGPGYAEPL
jgi:hypothetical protein